MPDFHLSLPGFAARDFLLRKARRKCLYGGRASGKTWVFAHCMIARAVTEKLRIAVCRYTTASTQWSARQVLIDVIHRLGMVDLWHIPSGDSDGTIRCRLNGSEIFFHGLSTVVRERIRGWENVNLCWVEEAQDLPSQTALVLIPTIRAAGAELWFSFNPRSRSDWVWQEFVVNPRPTDVIRKVSWRDVQKHLSKDILDEIEHQKRTDPDLYAHVWEGEPDDGGLVRHVLPYRLLMHCVELGQTLEKQYDGRRHVGLDVADLGTDHNALVSRRGPLVEHVEQWRAGTLGETARRADNWAVEHEAAVLYYDAGGIGAGVRSHIMDMAKRPYALRPENFGGAVLGPTYHYTRDTRNKDFFSRRNAQLAWTLRLRAQASERYAVEGPGAVRLDRCLIFHPGVVSEALMAQLTQPVWEEDTSGRVKIDKQPDDAPSPDMFDALALSFAVDSRYGLQLSKYR